MRMVGYGRVSTDHEEQRDSLEHQQAFFQDFARARGHTLVRVYADQGISGKWLKKRDGFLQMLRDAERGEFELVVVKDISRFARNTVDSLESIRRLKALGIECIFVNNSLKVLGESEFIVTIMAAIAQEESANLSKRVKFGKDITSYNKIVVFIDRSPAECYNKFRMLWIGGTSPTAKTVFGRLQPQLLC